MHSSILEQKERKSLPTPVSALLMIVCGCWAMSVKTFAALNKKSDAVYISGRSLFFKSQLCEAASRNDIALLFVSTNVSTLIQRSLDLNWFNPKMNIFRVI